MSKPNIKFRDKKITVRYPSGISGFEDSDYAYQHENSYRMSIYKGIEKLCTKQTPTFEGANHTLLLLNGNLYGIGDNSHKQICYSNEKKYNKLQYITDNVVSAAAGKEYTAYIIGEDVKIRGDGKLCQSFRNVPGACKIFSTADDQFLLLTKDGEAFAFGNNSNGQIEENIKTEAFCINGFPFRYIWETWEKPLTVTTTDENGNVSTRGWTPMDTAEHLKKQVSFINDQDTYFRYMNLCLEYGEENIETDIELNVNLNPPSYFSPDFEHCYQEFNGSVNATVFVTNRYISKPIKLDDEKLQEYITLFLSADY